MITGLYIQALFRSNGEFVLNYLIHYDLRLNFSSANSVRLDSKWTPCT